MGIDQEVEFHEIEIQLFQEVDTLIMRSKFVIIIRSPDRANFHEIEIQKKPYEAISIS
jgi:hypothetical protein